jgi:hypothetical protein
MGLARLQAEGGRTSSETLHGLAPLFERIEVVEDKVVPLDATTRKSV